MSKKTKAPISFPAGPAVVPEKAPDRPPDLHQLELNAPQAQAIYSALFERGPDGKDHPIAFRYDGPAESWEWKAAAMAGAQRLVATLLQQIVAEMQKRGK